MSEAKQIEVMFDRLWPICRSILGEGFRQSLDILSEVMPHQRHEFSTGEKILDWTVPEEWVVRSAFLIDPNGKKRADFAENNLHLINYSAPFSGTLSLEELKPHLHSLPDQPNAIPYLTSYYAKRWGFCLTHEELSSLPSGQYQVKIETEFKPGKLVVAEAILPGESKEEILFSSYLCHPSLANNELSGPLVLAHLYQRLAAAPKRRFTYRFVIVPETIGTVAFLSRSGEHLKRWLRAGYQLTCIGDRGPFTYKSSRRENTLADRAALAVLEKQPGLRKYQFNPAIGSDERQYCSPGFNLPVGSIMRTMYSEFPEYHTSLDNKSFMDFDGMVATIDQIEKIANSLEKKNTWKSLFPYGEPQLGPRGLYRSLSGKNRKQEEMAIW